MTQAIGQRTEDLSGDPLLQQAIQDVSGTRRPVLGGVPLLSKIADGTTGGLYYGVHPRLERPVAVKVMPVPAGNPSRVEQLMAQAQAALTIESPHVVGLFDAGVEAAVVFFVSEYVPSKSAEQHLSALRQRLKPGFDEAPALDACVAAVSGLGAAHQANVLHLCLRPSSVLIPEDAPNAPVYAKAKLDDLGRAYNDFSGRLLAGTAAETGMPGFMAPEQVGGATNLTPATDVFSFGAVMYALLLGQAPFDGPSLEVILSATAIHDAQDMRTWRPDVSRATAKVVEICLRKNPLARFADATVLRQALVICRAAREELLDAQVAAVEQIEALVPVAAPEPARTQAPRAALSALAPRGDAATRKTVVDLPPPAEQLASEEAPVEAAPVEAAAAEAEVTMLSAAPPSQEAEPPAEPPPVEPVAVPPAEPPPVEQAARPAAEPAPADPAAPPGADSIEVVPGSEVTMLAVSNPPAAPTRPAASDDGSEATMASPGSVPAVPAKTVLVDWHDPTLDQHEPPDYAQPRRRVSLALVAALLLVICGAVAWQMGWLDSFLKPKPKAVARALTPKTPDGKATPGKGDGQATPGKTEPDVVAEEARKKAEKEAEERTQAEAKAKAEQDRVAEEARKKAAAEKEAEEKTQVEAKAKAEQDRLAEEARKKAATDKEAEEKAQAEAKAKAEQDRLAEEARKKAAAEKEAEEKRQAEAKAKAEQDRLAEEARKKAAAEKEAEAKRVAEARAQQPAATAQPANEVALKLADNVTMEFVRVPAGTFAMGTDRVVLTALSKAFGVIEKEFLDEAPAHRASVEAFFIAKKPVTVAQFRVFVTATGFKTAAEKRGEAYVLRDRDWRRVPGACWKNPGFEQGDDHPVVLLSYRDCEAFAAWVSKVAGRPLRLPTEAEWEYAARGPRNNIYPWGSAWDGKLANHGDQRLAPVGPADWACSKDDDGFVFTSPAGSYANQSWCGALDMSGNVFQWCSDVYEQYPQNPNAPQIVGGDAPAAPDAPRVLRGGSYIQSPMSCRAAARRSSPPRAPSCESGMRLAFTPEQK